MIDEARIIAQLKDEAQREYAFNTLVQEYQEVLYWQIRRLVLTHEDADDVLQNTFLKAWVALDDFRAESKISTWLFRIAINESLSFLEKKKRNTDITSGIDGFLTNQLVADPYFDGDETQVLLQEAIAQLPDKQKAVFNLKYFQEMKYEDMSQMLGTSIGALKASYHHAVKKITDFFQQSD
ncbi:MAG: sigma-70 family RNA polymerase sigma factor [Bacteroidaceae bacterium]|nr:sigma-70 family RNA polymerase sigma factor [Bacteroidaceae bacterium]